MNKKELKRTNIELLYDLIDWLEFNIDLINEDDLINEYERKIELTYKVIKELRKMEE